MRALTLIFCLLFPMVAVSEEVIRLPFEKLPVGTRLVYTKTNGEEFSRYVSANDGESLALDEFRGNGDFRQTNVTDSLGRVISVERPKGKFHTFKPHSCLRVIGECSYTLTDPDGETSKRTYFGEVIDGILYAKLRSADDDSLLFSLEMTYRADGLLENAVIVTEYRENKGKTVTHHMKYVISPDGSIVD